MRSIIGLNMIYCIEIIYLRWIYIPSIFARLNKTAVVMHINEGVRVRTIHDQKTNIILLYLY